MVPTGDEIDEKLIELKQRFLDMMVPFYSLPISVQQEQTTADRPAKGPVWVSRQIFPRPTSDLVRVVMDAVNDLGNGVEQIQAPTSADVKVQWTGVRPGVGNSEPEPAIAEAAKYKELTAAATSKAVIVYFHGGLYYGGSPAASRRTTTSLVQLTGARCLVLDHRLCPQHPFPAALLDALLAYLCLLYPLEGSLHEAVDPKNIVFAGDSAGANLLLSLLMAIQSINKRDDSMVDFGNKKVKVAIPAGAMMIGAHGDLTNSLEESFKFDFLLPTLPCHSGLPRPCSIWPSNPPRGDITCETSALSHPLVSPLASRDWSKLPPLYFVYGEEYMGPEGKYMAQQATEQGTIVEYHHYQHMIHIFPEILPQLPQSKHVFQQMARFCRTCVEDPTNLKTRNVRYHPTDQRSEGVEEELPFSREHPHVVRARMLNEQLKRMPWTGSGAPSRTSSL